MANTLTGQVVKLSSDKTIKVSVVTYKNHPLYRKRYIYSKKYLVHDEKGEAQLQDRVVIKQVRPISRRKRWLLQEVVQHASHADLSSAAADQLKAAEKEAAAEATVKEKPAAKTKAKPASPPKASQAKKKEEEKEEAGESQQ